MQTLLPEGWQRPKGYSNGISAKGRLIFVAGQVGWTKNHEFPKAFSDQFRNTLENTLAVLKAGHAGPEHIVRMTWYLVDLEKYKSSLKSIGNIYQELIGRHYPAMAVVEINRLVEKEALIEIETTAVVPD